MPWERRDIIEEIHRQYPNKTILLGPVLDNPEEVNMYSGMCRGKLKILAIYDYWKDSPIIKRILNYPMNSIYEMMIAYKNGINEFYIGAELLHNLDKVKKFKQRTKCTIRLKANDADFGYENALTNTMAPLGSYILPQELNLDLINDTIDYMEFVTISPEQEAGYYETYFTDKYWGGEIGDIIPNLKNEYVYCVVRMMEPNDLKFRCNMGCLSNSTCRYCYRNVELANPSLYKNQDKPQD